MVAFRGAGRIPRLCMSSPASPMAISNGLPTALTRREQRLFFARTAGCDQATASVATRTTPPTRSTRLFSPPSAPCSVGRPLPCRTTSKWRCGWTFAALSERVVPCAFLPLFLLLVLLGSRRRPNFCVDSPSCGRANSAKTWRLATRSARSSIGCCERASPRANAFFIYIPNALPPDFPLAASKLRTPRLLPPSAAGAISCSLPS